MRFVCSEPYRTFRGYVFHNGNPVTINDRGTLEAIKTEPAFKEIADEQEKTPTEAKVLDPLACPKCGKALKKQGRHFHIRACKG